MKKSLLIFGTGVLFGVYAYRNYLRKTVLKLLFGEALCSEEPKTSEAEKES